MPAVDNAGRRQGTLAFSAFMLSFNATLLLCTAYLADQLPSGIAASLMLYFLVAAMLCLLGLVGCLHRSPALVDIFANHVLLDALLMTVPRLIFCASVSSLPGTLCRPSDFPNLFAPPTSPSLPSASLPKRGTSPDRCLVLMNTLMGLVACLAVVSGAAQWTVALRVREYAKSLGAVSVDAYDVESRGYEKLLVGEEQTAVGLGVLNEKAALAGIS